MLRIEYLTIQRGLRRLCAQTAHTGTSEQPKAGQQKSQLAYH
jgi:hypothetical protein